MVECRASRRALQFVARRDTKDLRVNIAADPLQRKLFTTLQQMASQQARKLVTATRKMESLI